MGIKFSQLPIASSVASDDYIAVLDSSESVLKRTPINHASQGSAYGLSTTTEYGHTKIVDNLSQNSLTNGEALSSRQGNVIANDMGQVELTSTAAYAHEQGSYFIFIGQFVKCIQAISVGDTINLGTNVEATSIGAVLGQLNSKIGNTDISSVGSSVTGAIATLSDAVSALPRKILYEKTYSTITDTWLQILADFKTQLVSNDLFGENCPVDAKLVIGTGELYDRIFTLNQRSSTLLSFMQFQGGTNEYFTRYIYIGDSYYFTYLKASTNGNTVDNISSSQLGSAITLKLAL